MINEGEKPRYKQRPDGLYVREPGILRSKRIVWICKANMGRSPMAEGVSNYCFPGTEFESASILEYPGTEPHSLIRNKFSEVGLPMKAGKSQKLRPDLLDFDTDVFVLDDPLLLLLMHPYVTKFSRSVVSVPKDDPSEVSPDSPNLSLKAKIHDSYKSIAHFVNTDLEDIILGVRNGDYADKTKDGVIYPWGVPNRVQSNNIYQSTGPFVIASNELFGYPFEPGYGTTSL